MLNGKKLVAFCGKGSFFAQGRCFGEASFALGEDLGCAMRETVRALDSRGCVSATPDQYPLECFDVFFFQDMPSRDDPVWTFASQRRRPRYLWVVENPLIDRLNADYGRYSEFTQVFTFEDEAVRKYGCRKLNYVFDFEKTYESPPDFSGRKFAVMISSRVKKLRPGLVSGERVRTIDYYERRHPDQFDLFGIGWEGGIKRLMAHPRCYRLVQAMRLAGLAPSSPCRVWRGMLDKKLPTIAKYRFSYCYENTTTISGYITEKLFDVLMAGTVPIYLGHSGTRKIFPQGLYVDRSDFKDDADLYSFLSSMSENEWTAYRNVARDFLADKQAHASFSVLNYVESVVPALLQNLE
jgi:alpha(1,3/1,4) fucosyltransferase